MADITLQQLRIAIPNATLSDCARFLQPLNRAMEIYDIDTPLRKAHFLCQIAWESGSLKNVVENLNYSAQGLRKTFPKYFTVTDAARYARKPEAIASRVYANRLGNGSEATGDGWQFRGRGLIQVTGRLNYRKYGYIVSPQIDPEKNPDALINPTWAADSAGWFWKANHLNEKADKDEHTNITKAINGSTATASKRLPFLRNAKIAMGLIKTK